MSKVYNKMMRERQLLYQRLEEYLSVPHHGVDFIIDRLVVDIRFVPETEMREKYRKEIFITGSLDLDFTTKDHKLKDRFIYNEYVHIHKPKQRKFLKTHAQRLKNQKKRENLVSQAFAVKEVGSFEFTCHVGLVIDQWISREINKSIVLTDPYGEYSEGENIKLK